MLTVNALCPRCYRLLPLTPQGCCHDCMQPTVPTPTPLEMGVMSEPNSPLPLPNLSAISGANAIRTSHYGKPADIYRPPDEADDEPDDGPSDEVEGALHLGVEWIRRLILISVVTAILTLSILSLAKRNRAAQAEAFVRAQIGLKQQERTAQLVAALSELSDIYSELKLKGRENPSTESHKVWRADWRQRLQQVVLEYRLDGQVDFTRTHTTAEAALRDVQLYLFSLDREWRGAVDEASPISRQLELSLKEARNDLN